MTSYHKKDFQCCKLNNQQLMVISKKSTQIVEDPIVIGIVEKLLNSSVDVLNNEPDVSDEIIDYLCHELGIISLARSKGMGINKVFVISDSQIFCDQISELIRINGLENIHVISNPEEIDQGDAAIVSFFIRYDEEIIRKIYAQLKFYENLYLVSSYILGGIGFVDNLYRVGDGSPCHFCNLGEMKGEQANKITHQEQSFFMIHNYILNNKLPLNSTVGVSQADIGVMAKKVFNKVKVLFSTEKSNLEVERLQFLDRYHFETDMMTSDVTLHWQYCDCLRENL